MSEGEGQGETWKKLDFDLSWKWAKYIYHLLQ